MNTVLLLFSALLSTSFLSTRDSATVNLAYPVMTEEVTWKETGVYGARCMAVNSKRQILAGTFGVLRSNDNGKSWILYSIPNTSWEVNTITITSKDIIYATTFDYKLYRSINDGVNWEQLFIDSTSFTFTCVAVNSLDDIFVGTEYRGLFRVTGDGDSLIATGWNDAVERLTISKNDDMFLLSNWVYHSNDKGKNWTQASNGLTNTGVNAFAFNSHGDVFAGTAASNGGVFISKDNGGFWTPTKYAFYEAFDSVVVALACSPLDDLFIGTFGAGIFMLNGDGNSLIQVNTGLPPYLPVIFSFLFTPDGHVLVGTQEKLYISEQIITSAITVPPAITGLVSAGYNFPNPFENQTTINYSLLENIHIQVAVFNVSGQLIETLLDQDQPPGNYRLIWDGSDKDPGVYYYRIKAGDYQVTGKMVLTGR